MSRELRPGDRVTATGTVVGHGDGDLLIHWDGYEQGQGSWALPKGLTLIEPAEPPVGSVVVKDGEAFVRTEIENTSTPWHSIRVTRKWSDLSDGDVIFRAGEDA